MCVLLLLYACLGVNTARSRLCIVCVCVSCLCSVEFRVCGCLFLLFSPLWVGGSLQHSQRCVCRPSCIVAWRRPWNIRVSSHYYIAVPSLTPTMPQYQSHRKQPLPPRFQ